MQESIDTIGIASAVAQARRGQDEGGLPIGAALIQDAAVISVGRNRREQHRDPIAHAELDCLRNAGVLPSSIYASCTIYSTLSPCWMCAGAIRLYGIPRVIIADDAVGVAYSEQWKATDKFFAEAGIEFKLMKHRSMIELFRDFLEDRPDLWQGDVAGDANG